MRVYQHSLEVKRRGGGHAHIGGGAHVLVNK